MDNHPQEIITGEAPVIKLVNLFISEAIQKGASDIHLEPQKVNLIMRYRIDGILYKMQSFPSSLQESITSRIKIMASMDLAEKRLPQDGRITFSLVEANKTVDLRISILPSLYGEAVVIRILDKPAYLLNLGELGFSADTRKEIERIISLPHGLILVTGPTGSGKSTTLYSWLNHLNKEDRKIITIEDPVEFEIDRIDQVEVKPLIGLSFANVLRSLVRQSPDIIMVGEIRDYETANIAIQIALTGHLLLSTLHTNDAPSSITRLVDMGIPPYLITSTLRAVLAQRLVRLLCPFCKEEYIPQGIEKAKIQEAFPEEKEPKIFRKKGCFKCDQIGYKGRAGIFELLVVDDTIKELTLKRATSSLLIQRACSLGMRTLKEDGIKKVLEGKTTLEEVLRVTEIQE